MADIRINSLPSTASASSSDDFLALDGATNGTRKLNAYSPTFGGNLIVGGTITSSGVVDFAVSANSTQVFTIQNTSTGASAATRLTIVGGTSSGSIQLYGSGHSTPNILQFSSPSSQKWLNNGAEVMSLSSGGNLTTSGNLTVSGTGTSTFGGKIQTTSANGIEAIVASGNTGLSLQSSTTQYSLYLNKADDSYRVYSSIGNTDRLMLTSGGNLLLGTTTDGGQKLQVAGSSAINRGSSGTVLALLTGASGNYGDISIGRTAAEHYIGVSAGTSNYITGSAAGDFILLGANGTNMLFGIGGTVALTLNSSQNATFAGNIASASKYDNTGTTSIAGSSTATIYTFPNASNKMYLVTVRQQGSASNNAMAMVFTNGTSASVTRIAQDNTNPSLTIDFSFSGLALQITPGSGYGTTTWERTITNIK